MTAFKTTLLILTFAAFQFFALSSAAQPVLFAGGHFTDRFGPNSLPELPVGDKVQIFAALNSNDPIESPTISVEAVQGGTTLTLDPIGPLYPIFEGYHLYYKFIDFDPALTGQWQITPTDSMGTGPSAFTNAIAEPEFLPLVENITVQGTSLGARVGWTLPNLAGFDVDGIFIRAIEAESGRHEWSSDLLPSQTTSFVPPPGILQAGVDYVYWINLVDLVDIQGPYVENSSKAFSNPFRYTALTTNGDFNLDGTVDAADYVVWRNGLGTTYTQTDYNAWRSHFGQTAGSGAALPSAVPEPSSNVVLLLFPAAGIVLARRVRSARFGLSRLL